MALLNRFSKLNDRGETGIFTFIVTKSVTRDFHRDATTKDFCFGYHRWAISFQRPTEKVLGVHLLLRNASPNTACVVDFTLTLLNREHFSQNQVYSKRQAKFTITNPMQGVSRWIQMSELIERRFSNETGEFLFELSLSNMTTIFECDIQMSPSTLNQYKTMLKGAGSSQPQGYTPTAVSQHPSQGHNQHDKQHAANETSVKARGSEQLINLETNCFTFGAFDWSLTIVPLVVSSRSSPISQQQAASDKIVPTSSSNKSTSIIINNNSNKNNLLTPTKHHSNSNLSLSSSSGAGQQQQQQKQNNNVLNPPHHHKLQQTVEPVCRVYLNRLNGFDSLCRVKYRVILGHHQQGVGAQSAEFVDSKTLDQISDNGGRIRGYQFRNTNIMKLVSARSCHQNTTINSNQANSPPSLASSHHHHHHGKHHGHHHGHGHNHQNYHQQQTSVDLRVHIEMFCANTVSEAKVPIHRRPNEAQLSNCSDRNKQAWCVESDNESGETIRLKLFFMDLQSVPRNHIRYISWIAYLVRRDTKSGLMRDSIPVRNSPHSNYYLQDGIDMGTIMETDIKVKELNNSPQSYLDGNMLTVHIEWVDSLLLFSHLYNNYDALATIQRHQISRELDALQQEYEYLEKKHDQTCKTLERVLNNEKNPNSDNNDTSRDQSPQREQQRQQQSITNFADNHGTINNKQSESLAMMSANMQQQSYSSSSRLIKPTFQQIHSTQKQQHRLISNERDPASLDQRLSGWPISTQDAGNQFEFLPNHSLGVVSHAGYQSKPASPIMSQEERLKFSASTPPYSGYSSSTSSGQRYSQLGTVNSASMPKGGGNQTESSGANLSQLFAANTTATRRRRLPQQPTAKHIAPEIQSPLLPVRHSSEHQIDRCGSLQSVLLYQQKPWTSTASNEHLQRQQQNQQQHQQQQHQHYLQRVNRIQVSMDNVGEPSLLVDDELNHCQQQLVLGPANDQSHTIRLSSVTDGSRFAVTSSQQVISSPLKAASISFDADGTMQTSLQTSEHQLDINRAFAMELKSSNLQAPMAPHLIDSSSSSPAATSDHQQQHRRLLIGQLESPENVPPIGSTSIDSRSVRALNSFVVPTTTTTATFARNQEEHQHQPQPQLQPQSLSLSQPQPQPQPQMHYSALISGGGAPNSAAARRQLAGECLQMELAANNDNMSTFAGLDEQLPLELLPGSARNSLGELPAALRGGAGHLHHRASNLMSSSETIHPSAERALIQREQRANSTTFAVPPSHIFTDRPLSDHQRRTSNDNEDEHEHELLGETLPSLRYKYNLHYGF